MSSCAGYTHSHTVLSIPTIHPSLSTHHQPSLSKHSPLSQPIVIHQLVDYYSTMGHAATIVNLSQHPDWGNRVWSKFPPLGEVCLVHLPTGFAFIVHVRVLQ